jgi:hypothetical protein
MEASSVLGEIKRNICAWWRLHIKAGIGALHGSLNAAGLSAPHGVVNELKSTMH